MAETRTCGECARFKVPDAGCPHYESFTEYVDGRPLMDAHCAACSDFHQARKAKDKKAKKQMKDSGITVDGCFEAVYHNGKPYFLVKNHESFSIIESLEVDGQVFYPKERKSVPYESYGYFEGSVPNREELFWKVREEFESFVDVESIWKDVLSSFVLLTYHQEKLQTIPYIYLYGDNESGKSTVLQLLNSLCYRPLYGVTIPAADIYGYLEDSDSIGTVLEDEIQGIHKDIDKIKIYKAGYKRGATAPRTLMTQNDRIIKYYGVFCLKACASEQLPTVKGFRERFVEIPMVEGYPQKEWADVTKEDLEQLRNLRNMLLKWRMLSRQWDLPNIELSMKGRLKELWKPVLQVTSGLTVYDGLFKFVEDQRKERLSIKQDTLEGKVVKVVVELYKHAKEPAPFISNLSIWHRLQEELDGKIDDKKPNVMDTSEFFQVTKAKVGYRLREVLSGKSHIEREKDSEGNWVSVRGFIFDPDKLRRVAKKYGYEFSTRLQSLQSSEGRQTLESMEKDHEDNVEKDAPAPLQLCKPRNVVTSEKEPLAPATEDRNISVKPSSISNISKNSKNENTVGEKNSNSVTITIGDLATQTKELIRLTTDFGIEKCFLCGSKGRPEWQVTLHDGSWGLLCESCGQKLSERLNKNELAG
jgi:hypothetical protein